MFDAPDIEQNAKNGGKTCHTNIKSSRGPAV